MIGLVIFLFLGCALLLLGLLARLCGLTIFAGLMVSATINSIENKIRTVNQNSEQAQVDAEYDRSCKRLDALSQPSTRPSAARAHLQRWLRPETLLQRLAPWSLIPSRNRRSTQ